MSMLAELRNPAETGVPTDYSEKETWRTTVADDRLTINRSVVDSDVTALTATEILTEYDGLIRIIINRLPYPVLHGATADIDDLWQVARLALLKAPKTFDPNQGVLFSTYAGTCVKNSLNSHLRTLDPLPERARRDMKLIQGTYNRDQRVRPTVAEIVEATGLTAERIQQVRNWERESHTEELADLKEHLTSRGTSSPEDSMIRSQTATGLRFAIRALPDRNRRILLAHILYSTPMREIAANENLSLGQISKICTTLTATLIQDHLD